MKHQVNSLTASPGGQAIDHLWQDLGSEGASPDAAVADLREALVGLIDEFGIFYDARHSRVIYERSDALAR